MTDEPKMKHEEKSEPRTFAEEMSVAGNQLLERVQDLLRQGNIRRLIIREHEGRTILEVPLTLGVIGGAGVAIFAPFLAAVGAIAALVSRVQIVIERYENPEDAEGEANKPTVAEKNPSDRLAE